MGDNLNQSDKSAQTKGKILHFVTITVVVVAAVVLCILLWDLMSVGYVRIRHQESSETITITADPTAPPLKTEDGEDNGLFQNAIDRKQNEEKQALQLEYPTRDDGTGDAGIMQVKDNRQSSSGLSGWQNSDGKMWYEVSKGTCYYGGWKEIGRKTYYFDFDGYAVTGWYCLGYHNGVYFDKEGVYVPDKDKSKMIAFTFDCGPSEYTAELLDTLAKNGAEATFFIQGNKAENYGSLIEKIAAGGHTLGCYTYTGSNLAMASNNEIVGEFSKTDEVIARFNNGQGSKIVRFPDGSYTPERAALTGKANILWDCETYDLETQDPTQIAANISAQIQGGVVIHMHDLTSTSLQAIKDFLPTLIATGYELVNIEDLAASRGYNLEPGVTYFGFTDEKVAEGRVNDR